MRWPGLVHGIAYYLCRESDIAAVGTTLYITQFCLRFKPITSQTPKRMRWVLRHSLRQKTGKAYFNNSQRLVERNHYLFTLQTNWSSVSVGGTSEYSSCVSPPVIFPITELFTRSTGQSAGKPPLSFSYTLGDIFGD